MNVNAPSVILCFSPSMDFPAWMESWKGRLIQLGYAPSDLDPLETDKIPDLLETNRPFFHCSQDSLRAFQRLGLAERLDLRFANIQIDPRDVAVTRAITKIQADSAKEKTPRDWLLEVICHHLAEVMDDATDWFGFSRRRPDLCLELRLSQATPGRDAADWQRLLAHVGCSGVAAQVSQPSLEEDNKPAIEEASVPKRCWVDWFDTGLCDAFKDLHGEKLIHLGWANSNDWGPRCAYLVSAPVSSGVAWLANALLALDIKTTNAAFLSDHWKMHLPEEPTEIGPKAWDHLRWHFPILDQRQSFYFRDGPEVLWEHRLDFSRHPGRPVVLFVRDARDAITSFYRRHYESTMSLSQYLDMPDTWPCHFPGLFCLPAPETWAYFHMAWLSLEGAFPLQVVRFEDIKHDPQKGLQRVLRFLDIERSNAQCEPAIASSSFEQARRVMEKTAQETGKTFLTVRRGQPFEWKETLSPDQLERFRGPVGGVLALLGYESQDASAATACRQAIFLSRRGLACGTVPSRIEAGFEEALDNGYENARLFFVQSILKQSADESAQHQLAAASVALDWIHAIFGPQHLRDLACRRMFFSFTNMNILFLEHPAVKSLIVQQLQKIVHGILLRQQVLKTRILQSLNDRNSGMAIDSFRELFTEQPSSMVTHLGQNSMLISLG